MDFPVYPEDQFLQDSEDLHLVMHRLNKELMKY